MTIQAVVFDLDGVIIDSEQLWHDVRRDFALAHGGSWDDDDQPAMMGANSMQWAARMRDHNGINLTDYEIYEGIISALRDEYRRHLPVIPGALETIRALATQYRLGVASSSPLELIEYVLELAGVRDCFGAVVSSDEVPVGKPAPDVYLEACRRLDTPPERAAAVEDSTNGLIAAKEAGLAVVAIPSPGYPPPPEVLALADVVLGSIRELVPEMVASLRKSAVSTTPRSM
ncbi:MAG: HAD family phosphatase [Thermoleophilia bacterium]|nr:HAD family phosphatase [Thermoleophilia bacterium]